MREFFNIVRADIKRGIFVRWKFLIFVFVIAFVFAISYFTKVNGIEKLGFVSGTNTFGDVLLYYFRGIEEYIHESGRPIEIPVQYFLTNLLAIYYVAYYPVQEIQGIGKNILINSNSRVKWWFSKCIWNVTAVTIVFLTELAAVILCSGILANDTFSWSLVPTNELTDYFYRADISGKNIENFALIILCSVYVARLSMSALQMLLSYVSKAILGYMITIFVLIYSVYEMSWCMPGNFMMTYRNVIVNANGVDLNSVLLVGAIIAVITLFVGGVYSHYKDYL